MKPSTLALIQIDNSEEVSIALGEASLEIFLGEFEDRVRQLTRGKDENNEDCEDCDTHQYQSLKALRNVRLTLRCVANIAG